MRLRARAAAAFRHILTEENTLGLVGLVWARAAAALLPLASIQDSASGVGEDVRASASVFILLCPAAAQASQSGAEGLSARLQRHEDLPRQVSSMEVLIWLLWAMQTGVQHICNLFAPWTLRLV